jgi:hypothetical protein
VGERNFLKKKNKKADALTPGAGVHPSGFYGAGERDFLKKNNKRLTP